MLRKPLRVSRREWISRTITYGFAGDNKRSRKAKKEKKRKKERKRLRNEASRRKLLGGAGADNVKLEAFGIFGGKRIFSEISRQEDTSGRLSRDERTVG